MHYSNLYKNNISQRIIKLGLLLSFIILTSNKTYSQEKKLNVISNWLQYTDASNSLYHHLADQAYDLLNQRDSIISKLKTLPDWRQRQRHVKKTLMDIVGTFPEKTPLNAKITGRVKKDDYIIENIIFESQPGFYVTSSLFIPKGLQKPAPAILDVIGHSTTSYRRPIYQHEILNLVKKGFIVFAYDPVGQDRKSTRLN